MTAHPNRQRYAYGGAAGRTFKGVPRSGRPTQPRERAVPCTEPGCPATTWNVDARCDDHGTTTGLGAHRG